MFNRATQRYGLWQQGSIRYRTRKNEFLLQNIKIMDFLIEIFEKHAGIRHSIPEEEHNKKKNNDSPDHLKQRASLVCIE